ncbi:MAG: hypothetical protein U0736_02810 [Gemmataceae bacterium]
MVLIVTVIRYVPGVLGDPDSLVEESHSGSASSNIPSTPARERFAGPDVRVLLSGNHPAVAAGRAVRQRSRPGDANTIEATCKEVMGHDEPLARAGRTGRR